MMNLIIELGVVCSLVFLEQQIDLENINYDKFLYPVKNTKAKNRSLNSSLVSEATLAWDQAPHWGKKGKSACAEKKWASEASRAVVWGEKGWWRFRRPRPPLFYFTPFLPFLPFPPLRSLVPG